MCGQAGGGWRADALVSDRGCADRGRDPAAAAAFRPAARRADGDGELAAAASGRAADRRGARLSPSARPSHRLRRAALYPLLRLYHGAVPAAARRSSRLADIPRDADPVARSEEHTSELQSLMRISYAVFCLKKTTIHIYLITNM